MKATAEKANPIIINELLMKIYYNKKASNYHRIRGFVILAYVIILHIA